MHLARRAALVLSAALGALLLLPGTASAALNQQDRQWMVAAHQSNLAEIAAGRAAQREATTDTVRELGQMFIEHHTRLDRQLTAAADDLGVELPDAPSPAQRQQLAAVTAKSGQAFDTAWIAQQIGSHRQSKALGAQELANGQDATAKRLARASAPVIQRHLNELLAAADRYGVPTAVAAGTGGQAADSQRMAGLTLVGGGLLVVALTTSVIARRRRV
jgi:putative membrane protein